MILVVLAGLLAWGALQPADAGTTHVLTAAHDLPAGHRIQATDLRSTPWPRGATVPGLLQRASVVDAVTTAPVSAGEPLTGSRVRTGRTWPGVRAGDVVTAVPVADPAVLRLVRSGDHVDVIGAATESPGSAGSEMVGLDLPVLMVTTADTARGGSTSGAVWVSASSAVAARLARAATVGRTSGAGLAVVLRPTA